MTWQLLASTDAATITTTGRNVHLHQNGYRLIEWASIAQPFKDLGRPWCLLDDVVMMRMRTAATTKTTTIMVIVVAFSVVV